MSIFSIYIATFYVSSHLYSICSSRIHKDGFIALEYLILSWLFFKIRIIIYILTGFNFILKAFIKFWNPGIQRGVATGQWY